MILEELAHIVGKEQDKGTHEIYVRSLLKEYLQVYILYFVYSSAAFCQKLIFTGGTCLRHFYGLDRLSEDVDFDFIQPINPVHLHDELKIFFVKKYKYKDIQISLKQKGAQVLLKFPVLQKLGLAKQNESDWLHVKMDITPNPSTSYIVETHSKSQYGFNFVARHYDLPGLMSGKLHAILTRQHLKGREDTPALKGRDYYDLLWYLKKGVRPNMVRLCDMLGESITLAELIKRVDAQVGMATTKKQEYFQMDLIPLLKNQDMIFTYIRNYQKEYQEFKMQSFGSL